MYTIFQKATTIRNGVHLKYLFKINVLNKSFFSPFQTDESVSSDGDSESSSQPISTTPSSTRQQRGNTSDRQDTEHTNDSQNQSLSFLQFFSFAEHLKWKPSIITPIESGTNEMISNTEAMWKNSKAIDERQSFLQHLQMAKQIEFYSKRIHKHTYDAIYDLCNHEVGLSIQYLRAILRVSWSVYRYPILELCKMPWTVGMKKIPEISACLDRLIENNAPFPINITAAQADLHSFCVRLFLKFPESSLGDGDGLPYTTVHSVLGIMQNDVENLDESYRSTSWYRRIENTVGKEMRTRIVGYDTQEAPRPSDERAVDTPQPYWREGRAFLVEELNRLRGDVPPVSAVLLVDCFSVDLYDRLLIDIRGIYHSNQMASGNPQPSLARFELAHRALSSGYAFPTQTFLVNQALLEAYGTAREQRRGMFSNSGPIHHPSVCRQHRYEMSKNQTRARRRPYDE